MLRILIDGKIYVFRLLKIGLNVRTIDLMSEQFYPNRWNELNETLLQVFTFLYYHLYFHHRFVSFTDFYFEFVFVFDFCVRNQFIVNHLFCRLRQNSLVFRLLYKITRWEKKVDFQICLCINLVMLPDYANFQLFNIVNSLFRNISCLQITVWDLEDLIL